MNLITDIMNRLNERLEETKNPCKAYATEAAAEKAAIQICEDTNKVLGSDTSTAPNYIIVFHADMGKYVPVLLLNEFLNQQGVGGYVFYPASKGFWCA